MAGHKIHKRRMIGVVTSDKMNKTRVVQVERRLAHDKYGKYMTSRTKYKAHDGDPLFRVALAVTHARLGRLLGDRLVREDADVKLPAALHVTRDRDTRRFDLARGHEAARQGLQPELAEGERGRALGDAAHLPLLLFAPLNFFWSEHLKNPFPYSFPLPAMWIARRGSG